jgi:DNA-binding transcriptional ArsR family regulator
MKVELDKKSLFALASDTRLEILKTLQPMRRTVSQLSESLNIDKAAVYRHLKKMEEGGLVKRYEEHGFVYYGLSWKARDLLSPNENTRIIVLLSSTILFLAVLSFFIAVGLTATDTVPMLPPKGYDGGSDYNQQTREIVELAQQSPSTWVVPSIVFFVFMLLTTIGACRTLRKSKQRIDPSVESSDIPRPVPED